MKNVIIIAAVSKNNVIGNDNSLLWDIPEDKKYFRDTIKGKHVFIGHNTYTALPSSVLSNAKRVTVASRDILGDLKKVIHQGGCIYIAGGEKVYKAVIPYTNEMLITEVDSDVRGNKKFPTFSGWKNHIISEWKENSEGLKYRMIRYIK